MNQLDKISLTELCLLYTLILHVLIPQYYLIDEFSLHIVTTTGLLEYNIITTLNLIIGLPNGTSKTQIVIFLLK